MLMMCKKSALPVPGRRQTLREARQVNATTDPITAADRRRLKAARAEARVRAGEIGRVGGGSLREVFRQEVGTTVRSASPFLLSLVAAQGKSLDELVDRIEPSSGWPRSPGVAQITATRFRPLDDEPPYRLVSTESGWTKAFRIRGIGHGFTFARSGDDWAILEIVGHSLEVEALIAGLRFETLFGVLRIAMEHRLPETLAAGCVGRLIGDVIDHLSLRERGWVITGIEEPVSPTVPQALIVATGSTPYRMPWAR